MDSIQNPEIRSLIYVIGGFFITQMLLVLGFVAKEVWRSKGKTEDKLTDALHVNTLAVTKLTVQMEMVLKTLEKIPELESDIAKLGRSFRDHRASHDS